MDQNSNFIQLEYPVKIMKISILAFAALSVLLFLQFGCAKPPIPSDPKLKKIDSSYLPAPDLYLNISGLSPCTTSTETEIHLNSREPVVVLVHGCKGSAGRFRALAQVFAFHGQQTVCFSYNDRDSLVESSSELVDALSELSLAMDHQKMTIIGHSQGGLIARKALVEEGETKSFEKSAAQMQLVTISSPFAGIAAADHCAQLSARLWSFGLVVPFCKLISGDKWYEITKPSPFMQKPGVLMAKVTDHIKVVTDESGSCRSFDSDGTCAQDDFVFSVDEQYSEAVDQSARVENIELLAGHVEIVGDYNITPDKLITLMQQKGILRETPVTKQELLSVLLSHLYDEP